MISKPEQFTENFFSSDSCRIKYQTKFAAWKNEYFDGAPTARKISSSPTSVADPRISLAKSQPVSSTIIPSKLDIHQRNQYNRVNHSSHIYNNNNNNRIGSNSYHNPLPSSHIDHSDDLALHHHHHTTTTAATTSLSPTKSYNYYNRSSATQLNQTNSSTHNYYSNSRYLSDSIDPYVDEQAAGDSRRFTERRKKTVRFDGQDSDEFSRWESERQGSQDSTTKDSGIDTSSTFTSSEDSNRGDGPKVEFAN
jgi:hypothetical protein